MCGINYGDEERRNRHVVQAKCILLQPVEWRRNRGGFRCLVKMCLLEVPAGNYPRHSCNPWPPCAAVEDLAQRHKPGTRRNSWSTFAIPSLDPEHVNLTAKSHNTRASPPIDHHNFYSCQSLLSKRSPWTLMHCQPRTANICVDSDCGPGS